MVNSHFLALFTVREVTTDTIDHNDRPVAVGGIGNGSVYDLEFVIASPIAYDYGSRVL